MPIIEIAGSPIGTPIDPRWLDAVVERAGGILGDIEIALRVGLKAEIVWGEYCARCKAVVTDFSENDLGLRLKEVLIHVPHISGDQSLILCFEELDVEVYPDGCLDVWIPKSNPIASFGIRHHFILEEDVPPRFKPISNLSVHLGEIKEAR